MIVKIKKRHKNGVIKLMGGGKIKEVLVNADITDLNKKKISICFRGNMDSGIVELSHEEAMDLQETLKKELSIIKEIKVIRSKK